MALEDTHFRALANASGLPIHHTFTVSSDHEITFPIPPETLARWYWTLGKIDIRYRYRINNYTFTRSAVLNAEAQKPSERSIRPPNLGIMNVRDPSMALFTTIFLHFNMAHFTAPNRCNVPFQFMEGDISENFLFCLSSTPPTSLFRCLNSHPTTFLDSPLTFYLYAKPTSYTGQIFDIQFTPTFFEFH
ncbi:MAG: hypothetical protein LBR62_00660 [Puniceicoccales bacterium]|jgi:hypothetical protein|nr:hypothetical protein [Puniceicoccales bacterium]